LLKTAPVAVSAVASEAIWRSRCAGSSLGMKGSSFLFFLDTTSAPAGFRFRFFASDDPADAAASGLRWILKKSTILVWTRGNSAARRDESPIQETSANRLHCKIDEREGSGCSRLGFLAVAAEEAAADLDLAGPGERQDGQNQSPAGTRGRMGRRQKMWNPRSQPSHSISSAAASPDPQASQPTSSSPPAPARLGGVRARVRRRSWPAAPIR
jgi:hypothetical protein